MTVYVVTRTAEGECEAGVYMLAIYSSAEAAARHATLIQGAVVEEHALDPEPGTAGVPREPRQAYCCRLDLATGAIQEEWVTGTSNYEPGSATWGMATAYNGRGGPVIMAGSFLSAEHARELVQRRRRAWLKRTGGEVRAYNPIEEMRRKLAEN